MSNPRRVHRAGSSSQAGFTLIEVLICTLILTTGMIAIAALLGVTTQMQIGAREAAHSNFVNRPAKRP